ncbi:MAG: shikimate kinase [Actinomycetaceae bacterium]|nr:shikimate kinase [Actinomycetaceae bacterium]
MPNPVIYIVGMPGSGKTTLAQKAAADLEWVQIDLDKLIEKQTQSTIAELFAISETAFRDAEEKALHGEKPTEPTFISCGGGVIERASNREFLKKQLVIYLDCPIEVIWNRIKHDENRPLLDGEDHSEKRLKLAEIFVRRQNWFKEVASLTLPVGTYGLETDAAALEEAVEKLLENTHA